MASFSPPEMPTSTERSSGTFSLSTSTGADMRKHAMAAPATIGNDSNDSFQYLQEFTLAADDDTDMETVDYGPSAPSARRSKLRTTSSHATRSGSAPSKVSCAKRSKGVKSETILLPIRVEKGLKPPYTPRKG